MTKKPQGVFVVGTDTGVGKTLVAAGLAWALRRRGLSVGVMKPVETGVVRNAGSDAMLLRLASGSQDAISEISPYRFGAPLAPLVAAKRQGARVSLPTLVQAFRTLAARHHVVIVEGVGGLMVPLNETKTTIDLARALNLPLVLVIGNRLGAINHTLLTAEAATARRLKILGGVVNQMTRTRDVAARSNPLVLQGLLSLPRWAVVPYIETARMNWEVMGRQLERAGFLKDLIGPARR